MTQIENNEGIMGTVKKNDGPEPKGQKQIPQTPAKPATTPANGVTIKPLKIVRRTP